MIEILVKNDKVIFIKSERAKKVVWVEGSPVPSYSC